MGYSTICDRHLHTSVVGEGVSSVQRVELVRGLRLRSRTGRTHYLVLLGRGACGRTVCRVCLVRVDAIAKSMSHVDQGSFADRTKWVSASERQRVLACPRTYSILS